MDVRGGVVCLEGLENRPELEFIEVTPSKMGIEHRALQPQRRHAAFDLGDGTLDVLRREHRETRIPIGVTAAGLGQAVIGESGKIGALARLEHLDAGGRQQQQLLIDAELVHAGDASLADIHELILQRGEVPRTCPPCATTGRRGRSQRPAGEPALREFRECSTLPRWQFAGTVRPDRWRGVAAPGPAWRPHQ